MVKRIAACVREYRRDSLLTPLYVALEVLLEVLIPLVMADLIDRGIEAGDMGHILRTGAVLVVSENRKVSCATMHTCERKVASGQSRASMPSMSTWPTVGS